MLGNLGWTMPQIATHQSEAPIKIWLNEVDLETQWRNRVRVRWTGVLSSLHWGLPGSQFGHKSRPRVHAAASPNLPLFLGPFCQVQVPWSGFQLLLEAGSQTFVGSKEYGAHTEPPGTSWSCTCQESNSTTAWTQGLRKRHQLSGRHHTCFDDIERSGQPGC